MPKTWCHDVDERPTACQREIDEHDPVLLDDTDQENDADQRGERLQPSASCDGANPIGSILAQDELT
jgi:hypothetical protein